MPLKDKDKRISEIEIIVDSFLAEYSGLLDKYSCTIFPDAAKRITNAYEVLLDDYIKRYINEESRAQIYKVASGLELATVYVRPIRSSSASNDTIETNLNAILAYCVGGAMLLQERFTNFEPIFTSSLDDECYAVYQNHMEFLRYALLDALPNLPTFSNSIYWQSYEVILKLDGMLSQN